MRRTKLRREPSRRLLVAAGLLVLCACSSRPETPDIILISIDSLRPDHLGVYGHDRDTSPSIDGFASEAVIFDRAFSTTSWTLPSHASMLTGLYPEVHGVVEGKQRLGEDAILLSEMLQDEGYQTLAVVSGPYLRSRFGFNQGWNDYDDYTISVRGKRATTGGPFTPQQHRRILEMLDQADERPLFMFLHYWDVHYDYNPPEPWRSKFDPDYEGDLDVSLFTRNESIHPDMDPRDLEHLLALYDGEIAFTDHYLGLLFEALRARGRFENSIIVVTSDHGDEFFEHGQKGHRANLYNATLEIPLIIRFPNGEWGGERIRSPVSLVDIPATVLDYLRVDGKDGLNGKSLLPLIEERPETQSRIVFADLANRHKSMINGPWKIVADMNGSTELEIYDLSSDPDEQQNVIETQEARGDDMLDALRIWLAVARRQSRDRSRESVEYDDETRQVLESLGYLD